jgi:ABC-2 type transport system permease protein
MSAVTAVRPHAHERSTGALVAHEVHYNVRSFRRNRQTQFFTIALPVLFLVIFCALFGNGTVHVAGGTIKESTYYVPGLVGLGIIQASFTTLVVSIVAQRESGILKRRRSTPVRAWILIAGRALTQVGIAGVMAVILILIGWLIYGASVPGRTIPAIAVTTAVGASSFCALAYALASVINSADAAQPVVQFVILPLYFISGVFVPSSEIPHWLLDVADVFPVRHLQQALLKAFNPHTVGAGFAWSDLLVLAIWGLASLAIGVWHFGWEPKAS